MEPDVERRAQGERLLRHLVETGFFVRDDRGDFYPVEGAPQPDLTVICDRHGHVMPAIEDYITAIAHVPAAAGETHLPSAG
jgi:hypothetical protein